jgi:tRNA (guanine37-N1)-methyltransferase
MNIEIVTLFPDMFAGPFDESIIKRAQNSNQIRINIHNLRNWTTDKHKTVDDRPYGGGAGMVMMVEPIYKAVKDIKLKNKKSTTLLTSAKGNLFNQKKAQTYSQIDQLIIICGHYEGVDQRVADHIADEEISIGEFVLTGGELPAMVITDSVVRLIPGVIGNPDSLIEESYSIENNQSDVKTGTIEYPQYTRPEQFRGWKVPSVLLSGNHKEIKAWQQKQPKIIVES